MPYKCPGVEMGGLGIDRDIRSRGLDRKERKLSFLSFLSRPRERMALYDYAP